MYGVKGKILRWLTSFPVDRRQRVVLEGARSPWYNVTSGVPQATILGPIMFLFYTNDWPETVTSTSKPFAEDYREIRDRPDSAWLLHQT